MRCYYKISLRCQVHRSFMLFWLFLISVYRFRILSTIDLLTYGQQVLKGRGCHVEELALPMHAIQLSGEVLSSDEAASVELREAEAVHRTRSSHCLFKAAPTTPCICREQQLETGLSNKRLKHTLELLLHCGGPAKPRLLCTTVPHTAAVVWTGTTGTWPAHNNTQP